MSRLWQALGAPLRTTAQYRVSVVFLTPDKLPPPAPAVHQYQLVAAPAAPPDDPPLPQLLSTRREVEFVAPGPTPVSYMQSPATTAPAPGGVTGQDVRVDGLMLADSDDILLVSYPGGVETETDVTATWKVPLTTPYPTPPAHGVPFIVRAPAGTPVAAGRYELRVARPAMPGFRSDSVPLSVAAWVDPAGGPLLTDAGGLYTLDVRGVPAARRRAAPRFSRRSLGSPTARRRLPASGSTARTRSPSSRPRACRQGSTSSGFGSPTSSRTPHGGRWSRDERAADGYLAGGDAGAGRGARVRDATAMAGLRRSVTVHDGIDAVLAGPSDPDDSVVAEAQEARGALAADPQWRRLVETLGVEQRDVEWLALLAACELVPPLTRVLGYLDDSASPAPPTPAAASVLWGWPLGYQPGPASSLTRWRLAEPDGGHWQPHEPMAHRPGHRVLRGGTKRVGCGCAPRSARSRSTGSTACTPSCSTR